MRVRSHPFGPAARAGSRSPALPDNVLHRVGAQAQSLPGISWGCDDISNDGVVHGDRGRDDS
jgi:hypothetical protein